MNEYKTITVIYLGKNGIVKKLQRKIIKSEHGKISRIVIDNNKVVLDDNYIYLQKSRNQMIPVVMYNESTKKLLHPNKILNLKFFTKEEGVK